MHPYVEAWLKLKADLPHPHDYPHMLTDYRYTDKHLRLVRLLLLFAALGKAEPATVRP